MNLKTANLVAIQFGILVGIVCCLVYSRFESGKPRATAEERASAVEARSRHQDQRADLVDDRADPDRAQTITEQPIPVVENQYSPEAVERYRALAAQLYYQQIAPRRNTSATLTTSSTAAVALSDAEVTREPAVTATDDPAPQPVAYIEPTQVVVYPQAASFVAYSHRRRFADRCRPTPHHGELASNTHRRPDRRGTHLSVTTDWCPPKSLGVVHRRNTDAPACPSPRGFKSRGKR